MVTGLRFILAWVGNVSIKNKKHGSQINTVELDVFYAYIVENVKLQ